MDAPILPAVICCPGAIVVNCLLLLSEPHDKGGLPPAVRTQSIILFSGNQGRYNDRGSPQHGEFLKLVPQLCNVVHSVHPVFHFYHFPRHFVVLLTAEIVFNHCRCGAIIRLL